MKKINRISLVIVVILSSFLMVFSTYFKSTYENISIDELIYYLDSGLEGASLDVVYKGIKDNLFFFSMLLITLLFPLFNVGKYHYFLYLKEKNHLRGIKLYPFPEKLKWLYVLTISIVTLLYSIDALRLGEYTSKKSVSSNFIEEEYVIPTEEIVKFPQKKRNLIMIYLESFETTMMSKANAGGWDYSVTPELEQYAMNNINFSNTVAVGGALPVNGATWTIAGLVSINSGIPLKIPIDGNGYTQKDHFLKGANSLGDILANEGYNLRFMFGSDSKFGGRYQYFKTHGDYDIFDLNSVLTEGKMTEKEIVFWGFEDSKLFKWAKEETLDLAQQDKPFNLNLLTVNTHFEDGYLEADAETNFATQYENVHAHSSKQVADYIEWLKQQDFYENTTIVLVGDHISMQSLRYYEDKVDDNFRRVTLNTFINAIKTPVNEKNRQFSNFDLFPTVLSSIGVEIEGNRLGLGADLFSEENTLFERFGEHYVNEELGYNSNFYNNNFLQSDYLEMLNY